ncbi:MAG TPA: adenosylcobinamide-phosphate synthase CbiB [bacterium]|jgi:adenosylcobinamide-phosphate synthase
MTAVDLALACVFDAAIGDPRAWPHPVRLMGRAVVWYEGRARMVCRGPRGLRWAGSVLAIGLPLLSGAAAWLLILLANEVHGWIGRAVEVGLAAATLAWRDLMDHTGAVSKALGAGDLREARQAVARIVGRDADALTEGEVVRATVESMAESASDGVIAPFLFLLLGGAPLALAFKAINTLDSMVGHRNERYRDFGWASARLDDVANWVPGRITSVLFVLTAWPASGRFMMARRAWGALWRDGMKHPSPNSGRPEAAMAGALGVQLGGINYYDGIPNDRPLLGDAGDPLAPHHILRAQAVVTTAYVLMIALSVTLLWP